MPRIHWSTEMPQNSLTYWNAQEFIDLLKCIQHQCNFDALKSVLNFKLIFVHFCISCIKLKSNRKNFECWKIELEFNRNDFETQTNELISNQIKLYLFHFDALESESEYLALFLRRVLSPSRFFFWQHSSDLYLHHALTNFNQTWPQEPLPLSQFVIGLD